MAEFQAEMQEEIAENVIIKESAAAAAAAAAPEASAALDVESTFISDILREIFYSPMNLALLGIICFLIYKIVRDRTEVPSAGAQKPAEPELPKLRRDFTIQELRQFDGKQPDGRVLVAINGNVYDVTKGKRFYGPGGPYASFAGRDASRNLATFSVEPNEKDDYDDLSDLTAMEMDSVNEWEMQFKEKYEHVGKLLRKGEQPTNYEDDEEDENASLIEDVNATASAASVSVSAPACNQKVEAAVGGGLRQRQQAAAAETEAKKSTEEDTGDNRLGAQKQTGSHISLGTNSRTNITNGDEPNSTDC